MLGSKAAIYRGSGGFQVENSLWINNADNEYLTRTPSVAGNSDKLTISMWHKRSRLTDEGAYLIGAGNDGQNFTQLGYERFGTKDR